MTHEGILEDNLKAKKASTFTVGELEVLLIDRAEATYICIRGTESNWKDILRDLCVIPYRSELFGYGHRGFLRGAERVLEEIEGRYDRYRPLVFSGHSLGAAVALACAVGAHTKGMTVLEYVGFGCPKVFYNAKKKLPLKVKFTLYKNGKDIVTSIPFFLGRRIIKQNKLRGSYGWWKDHALENYLINFKTRTNKRESP